MNEHVDWAVRVEAGNPTVVEAPDTFKVPESAFDTRATLDVLAKTAGAARWAQAATVWAKVTPNAGEGNVSEEYWVNLPSTSKVSAREFARTQGGAALSTHNTVADRWNAWQWAVDNGHAKPSVSGETVVLPSVPWSDWVDARNGVKAAKGTSDLPAPVVFDYKLTLEERDVVGPVLDLLRGAKLDVGNVDGLLRFVNYAADKLGLTRPEPKE